LYELSLKINFLIVFDTWSFKPENLHKLRYGIGLFDECNYFRYGHIEGKYCNAIIPAGRKHKIENHFTFDNINLREIFHNFLNNGANEIEYQMGICVPKSCSTKDLYKLAQHYEIDKISTIKTFQCYEPPKMNSFDKFAMSNFRNLMKKNESSTAINCIDGLKSISALWIMIGHRKQFFGFPFQHKNLDHLSWWDYYLVRFVSEYATSVITFFVCSAILITLSLLKSLDTNIPQFIVSGPMFGSLIYKTSICREWWWALLAFVQNYTNNTSVCFNHSWYLSTDFQLFSVTPLIVYCIWKLRKESLIFGAIIFISFQWFTFYGMFIKGEKKVNIYEHMEYRLGQYFIGILTGYIIYDYKKLNLRLSNSKIALGWAFSICIISDRIFNFLSPSISTLHHIYDAVRDDMWACSICWIVFACHCLKSGGFFRAFLSQHSWQPISRMCLSIYLVHYQYMTLTYVNQKQVSWFGMWWQLQVYIGDIVTCMILSAIFHLFVEAPGIQLTTLLWSKRSNEINNQNVNTSKVKFSVF
ncbi:CLUMA_CG017427, isoform A, partial [Clunio marinus]